MWRNESSIDCIANVLFLRFLSPSMELELFSLSLSSPRHRINIPARLRLAIKLECVWNGIYFATFYLLRLSFRIETWERNLSAFARWSDRKNSPLLPEEQWKWNFQQWFDIHIASVNWIENTTSRNRRQSPRRWRKNRNAKYNLESQQQQFTKRSWSRPWKI